MKTWIIAAILIITSILLFFLFFLAAYHPDQGKPIPSLLTLIHVEIKSEGKNEKKKKDP